MMKVPKQKMKFSEQLKARKSIVMLAVLALLSVLLLVRCGPLSEQIVPSVVGTLTPTPLPMEIPLLPTPQPLELARSNELTSNIVLMGVLLVVVIVAGTFYGIQRSKKRR
jgi:hypothetical protein